MKLIQSGMYCSLAGMQLSQDQGYVFSNRLSIPLLRWWQRLQLHVSCCRVANWLLLDGLKGGSGEAYDWEKLQRPPLQESMSGWLLAGGLTPENVGKALSLAQPTGVDVSSGVTQPDGLLKDPEKVHKFVQQVWNNSA